MTRWAILTGEYPPQPGGVSDYTRVVARELAAAGDRVCVYAPAASGPPTHDAGVDVHRLPGHYGPRSLAILNRLLLAHPRPDRILVQYVPQAFGWKAMNLAFAGWLAGWARKIAPVDVMFHEVATPFAWRPPRYAILAVATRVMARLVAGAATRVFVSIPAWGVILKRMCPRLKSAAWVPVPCTFDFQPRPAAAADIRTRFTHTAGPLVGHFGTYGRHITTLLTPAIEELFRLVPAAMLMLVGRESDQFAQQLVAIHPAFRERVLATGELPLAEVSAHLQACDLLVQPFLDGISSRRTSAMAGYASGVPVVTNLGPLSEAVWAAGVAVAPAPDHLALAHRAAELLADPTGRAVCARDGLALYRDNFAIEHTIAKLRESL